jgi:MFS superfamily sulfate permease-like transporter
MIGYGVTKSDIVFVALFVLFVLVQPLVALALAVLWAAAFIARRRWKN